MSYVYIHLAMPLASIPDPREVAQSCACSGLREAARAVTQFYDAILAPSGVRATQFPLLVALSLAEGATMGRVAEILVMDRTTLTRNLRPLERQGWVRRIAGPDRRERSLALTKRGRAALDRALVLWRTAQDQVVRNLGPEKLAELRGGLAGIVAAVHSAA